MVNNREFQLFSAAMENTYSALMANGMTVHAVLLSSAMARLMHQAQMYGLANMWNANKDAARVPVQENQQDVDQAVQEEQKTKERKPKRKAKPEKENNNMDTIDMRAFDDGMPANSAPMSQYDTAESAQDANDQGLIDMTVDADENN